MGELPSNDLNRKIAGNDEVLKEIEVLDGDIAALRNLYEQYFLGLERRPPELQHKDLKKRLEKLKKAFVRQTALKFRINSLQSKFVTYERLWARTIQEMEAGTYRRDVYKARLHAKQREEKEKGAEPPPPPPEALHERAGAPQRPGAPQQQARPGAQPPPPPMAARGPAGAAPPGGLSDAKLKAIYDAYVIAKKRCNEDVSKLSYDQMATTLKKQVPELMKAHGAKTVEFKVVIKDGKAVLRAVPK